LLAFALNTVNPNKILSSAHYCGWLHKEKRETSATETIA